MEYQHSSGKHVMHTVEYLKQRSSIPGRFKTLSAMAWGCVNYIMKVLLSLYYVLHRLPSFHVLFPRSGDVIHPQLLGIRVWVRDYPPPPSDILDNSDDVNIYSMPTPISTPLDHGVDMRVQYVWENMPYSVMLG